jgi:hypothetical protein
VSTRRILAVFGLIGLVVSLPFVVLHLMAAPEDAPITPLQHVVAVLANYFGPWGVALVRLVDFPNAGLRLFIWVWAAAENSQAALADSVVCALGIVPCSLVWCGFEADCGRTALAHMKAIPAAERRAAGGDLLQYRAPWAVAIIGICAFRFIEEK